jgi:molybdopterin converting factor small subunit
MAQVTVAFHGLVCGKITERVERFYAPEGATVADVVDSFARQYLSISSGESKLAALLEGHVVMLNGVGLHGEKPLTVQVTEGDNVTIFLPVSGG